MLNIPEYRAKCIDSDKYIEGYYCNVCQLDFIITDDALKTFDADNNRVLFGSCESEIVQIDPTTLAIHFPDTNIEDLFFGLDNGLGASIIEAVFVDDISPFKGIAMHSHYGYVFFDKNNDWVHINKLKDIKVIGIQE